VGEQEGSAAGPALTEYAELHGCSCKVGQGDLEALLADAGLETEPQRDTPDRGDALLGIGDDAAARRLREDLALVSTVDFFTPVVDDPYDFGRIAACNAASDAFATGATDELSCLVVLGLPREVTDCAADIVAGMADALAAVDGEIVGGHTVLNPWPLAGGAVTATAHPDDVRSSAGAAPGDVLYLTKPLGTQPAAGALRTADGEFAETVAEAASRPVETIGAEAVDWMTTPNRDAARALREHASALTDVTGFGLRGQSRTLAARSAVGVELTRLPVIDGTPALSRLFGYGLERGESAETSGGLLAAVPPDSAADAEAALADADVFFRQVGRVTDGEDVELVDPTVEPVQR
jgi:selenide,water dikinase